MKKKITIIKLISFSTLFLFSILSSFVYKEYNDYRNLNEKFISYQEEMDKDTKIYINTILIENKNNAEMILSSNYNKIHDEILNAYTDDESLRKDISNPSSNTKLTKVFDDTIKNLYINENDMNNKPFAASKSLILWNPTDSIDNNDNSKIEWTDFKSFENNYSLAYFAYDAIKEMNTTKYDYVFWQFGENKDGFNDMSINSLYEVYKKYGLNGLKSYEILVPLYITNDGDIFGTSDVNKLGVKNDNYKIIIVQRINIYDALKPFKSNFEYLNTKFNYKEHELQKEVQEKMVIIIEMVFIAIGILCGCAYIQNKLLKLDEDK